MSNQKLNHIKELLPKIKECSLPLSWKKYKYCGECPECLDSNIEIEKYINKIVQGEKDKNYAFTHN